MKVFDNMKNTQTALVFLYLSQSFFQKHENGPKLHIYKQVVTVRRSKVTQPSES